MDRFIRHLEIERRLSPLTCKHYRRDLQALLAFCERSGIDGWGDLDDGHIRVFSAESFRKGLSARSIQRRLSAARTFFRYLMREKHVSKNPITSVSAPKGKKRLPGNLDADRMARLLEIQGDGAIVDRDRAILELLYSSGLRLSELTDLDCGDVDMHDRTVRVTGKGNKDRIVPVGSHALQALARWQASRAAMADAGETALFVSNRGTRISTRSVQARVSHWARRQGIDTNVYPHLFRHSFATHLLESSHDLRGVQELLGHSNIATTQVYTHLDFQHLAQIYDQTHPRARKKD
ncbi:MAG: tyrosine recombinase XerC [Gammaproteobacteria bacterium]|nr:tyrosine recombinase XerC [Gammaproteobacteria bacterium]MBT8109689.1 tyrosine recombinase XerC [Gammaproteobacteria bacterium]NND46509.1 tyrosine recombinase XerC [Woeseiaceae bacterium]NNL44393.1 tyrosine recombinase XerC [Woeseiaceae bacterium]